MGSFVLETSCVAPQGFRHGNTAKWFVNALRDFFWQNGRFQQKKHIC